MVGLDRYVNRTVRYAFCGEELFFALSHALFSSFTVDQGTTLLLKTVAQRIDLEDAASALDVGCGVGVVGICLKRRAPRLAVLMQDRDALAVEFSRENGARNGAAGIELSCALALAGLGERKFDLIASNWPAKAGPAVLADFCLRAPGHLSGKGVVAMVIVHTLADDLKGLLGRFGHEILHEERSPGHAVFHFRRGPDASAPSAATDPFSPYGRTEKTFSRHGTSYSLRTVYGLPDFDTVGHQTEALLDLLRGMDVRGDLLFWNPGQGHAAVAVCRRGCGVTLCSRDVLELEAARRNVEPLLDAVPSCLAVPSEGALPEALSGRRFALFCAVPHPVPGVRWQEDMREAALRLLAPGGRLCLAGTSTEIGRFLDAARGLRLEAQKREHGVRAALLTRP